MSHLVRNSLVVGSVATFANQSYLRSFNFDQLYDAAVRSWKVTSAANASSVDAQDSRLASAVAMKESLRARTTWLEYSRAFVFRVAASCDIDEIGQTVNHVMAVIDSLGPKAMDLTTVESKALQPEHMVAVLRSTFLWKDQVPGWSRALGELSAALRAAGHDPQEVLVGLE